MSNKTDFRSGFVSIIGLPNVGKSTLINSLVGEKIAIISNKPQTTRNRIQGILTGEDYQAVFVDTPGMHEPKNKLGEYMMKSAEGTLNDADIILLVVDPSERGIKKNEQILSRLSARKRAVFLVINKIDTVEKQNLLSLIEKYGGMVDFKEIIPLSALKGENIGLLLDKIKEHLPPGPKYFPDDSVTDQPERQICAEMIREKVLVLMRDEIPHGIAVEIMSMKKRADKDMIDIEATIYCEKESHKGMIIGKKGALLKEIGARSRADIERALGMPVYLQLWVKVKAGWRDNNFLLKDFGYK